MNCPKCRAVVDGESKFCTSCGHDLSSVAVTAYTSAATDDAVQLPKTNAVHSGDLGNTYASSHDHSYKAGADSFEKKNTKFISGGFPGEKKKSNFLAVAPKLGFGYRVLSFFLCLVLFFAIMTASGVGVLKSFVSPEVLDDSAKDIDVAELEFNGKSISEIIYDSCSKEIRNRYYIKDEKVIEDILEAVDFDEAMDDVVRPSIDYAIGRKEKIDAEKLANKIIKVYDENVDVIAEQLEKRIPHEEWLDYNYELNFGNDKVIVLNPGEKLRSNLKLQDASKELIIKETENIVKNYENIKRDNRFLIDTITGWIRLVYEPMFYIGLILLCVLLFGLIFLSNKFRLFSTLNSVGIVSIISGTYFALLFAGGAIVKRMFKNIPQLLLDFLAPVSSAVLTRMIIFLVAGIVLCVVSNVVAASLNKKNV